MVDEAVLEAKGLSKSFGGRVAVDEASFRVDRGSITSLIGPNGAGKTTAFNMLSGVLAPDSGKVHFDGSDVTGRLPHQIVRLGLARTFQVTRSIPNLTTLENLVLAATEHGWRWLLRRRVAAAEREEAMDVLSLIGLSALADKPALQLSFGQKKLLELGSAMISHPRLMLLDEPAAGVNPALLEKLIAHIRTLNEKGTSFLVVEHNVGLVMDLSDSVIVMAHGRVLVQGAPAAIQNDDLVLDAYLGRA